jgi:DNA polymerase-3 subunit delta'
MALQLPDYNRISVNRLNRIVRGGRLSHAYIFSGCASEDRGKIAKEFAKAAQCAAAADERPCGRCPACRKIEGGGYADLLYLRKSEKSIGVKQVEELQARLRNRPYAADRMIAIVEDADSMTAESQNKFLKTLEEPNPGAIIVLLPENPERLLKTIVSRCVLLRFARTGRSGDAAVWSLAGALLDAVRRRAPYYETVKLLTDIGKDRDAARALLDALEMRTRDRLVEGFAAGAADTEQKALTAFVAHIETARQDINGGIHTGYALKNMILQPAYKGYDSF